MRFLKRLELQGYKTFATRTEFLFDEGVTAIVGPNGSGKSNVMDALRWVLGEQSFSMLRARRSEDMIFSGSEQRARLGMAGASLTFDNALGWLPIDFSEVEISRRAYRSGENEYHINGNRVRLRDVTELLGNSGLSERTYTVIGQGLIDQALSQRPEERRRLFEEAAGITVHQGKREQAVRQLDEAHGNLTRAQDIVSELTPRLRYLKGQARRAQEYQQIKSDLEAQLRVWYGFRWHEALAAVSGAQARLAVSAEATEAQAEVLNAFLSDVAGRRAERNELRDRLSEWHRASSQLHRQAETAQRELAVRSEQHRLLGEQNEDLQSDIDNLRAGLEDGAARLAGAEVELAEATSAHEAQAAQVAAAQAELAERERLRKASSGHLAQTEEALIALKTQSADRRARLGQLAERRSELVRGRESGAQTIAAAEAEVLSYEAQLAGAQEKLTADRAALAEIERQRSAHEQVLSAAQEAERAAADRFSAAQRGLARLQDQQDLLSRLRDEGAGLGVGPRTVLAAWAGEQRGRPQDEVSERANPAPLSGRSDRPGGRLAGIVGALGDLIQVPANLERAMEAALGGRMQDIVVRRWQDAEAAVAFLKQRQGGRATFLPLDSLRPSRGVNAPPMAGVLGVASDLVKFDPSIQPAVDLALNHIIVVQDLPTARKMVKGDGRATLVTLEGDIVRPGGSVTGGSESSRRDSGMLSRTRELRELPERVAVAQAQVQAGQADVRAAREEQQAYRDAIEALRGRQKELSAGLERLAAERNRLQLALDRSRQNLGWRREQQEQAGRELAGLTDREDGLVVELATLTEQVGAQEAAVETARRELAALETEDAVAGLARQQAQAEISSRQRQRYAGRVDELRATQRQRTAEIAAKEEKIRALAGQRAEADAVITRQGQIAQDLADKIADLNRQIDPAEARLAQIEGAQRADEGRERQLREQLRLAQMHQSQAELALQRARDELAHLRGEIEKELGLVALAGEDEVLGTSQQPLPLDEMVTRLEPVAELPEGLDHDVRSLRAQIGRLGPVNLEAPAEYAEVETRYNFLIGQAADLERAVSSLEEVITELDRVMEREFLATFKAIAAQFKEEFKILFGGGAARLVLADPDDPANSGIEIIARPPGKREQGLALLSGGERAMTAAALIFSILKVRPTPFCVLDEVDAALDEANAGRFREALKALSDQTQFILITHNRNTIEAADTIYGISMGADNTSQVLSLKLDGEEVAPGRVAEAVAAATHVPEKVEG